MVCPYLLVLLSLPEKATRVIIHYTILSKVLSCYMTQSINEVLSLTTPSPLDLFRPDWDGAETLTIYIKRDDFNPETVGKVSKAILFLFQAPHDCMKPAA